MQLKQLEFHHLFSASATPPTLLLHQNSLMKNSSWLSIPLRSASVPVTSYIAAHLTNQHSICLYCAVICKKHIKVLCESHS